MKINLSFDEAVSKAVKHQAIEEGCLVFYLVQEWLRLHLEFPANPPTENKIGQRFCSPCYACRNLDMTRRGSLPSRRDRTV